MEFSLAGDRVIHKTTGLSAVGISEHSFINEELAV
jgi:hypothetical protein